MNDRFKFRVWSKQDKQYLDDNFFLTPNGELGCYIKECSLWGLLKNNDLYVIEQCTGIKDRCGKLIYEGDLIRLVIYGEIKKQGVVEWCNLGGTFGGAWQATKHTINGSILADFFSSRWEIIGNIHEMEKLNKEIENEVY